MKKGWLWWVILPLVLAACLEPAARISPLAQPTATLSVLPTPHLQKEENMEKNEEENIMFVELRDQVAARLKMDPAELKVVSAEEVTWPDASLGCPQPGQMYAQVLMPGWRIVFSDAAGREYDVHTSANRQTFVICASPTESHPLTPSTQSRYPHSPAVRAAIKVLAEHESVPPESVRVLTVEAVQWANSCLGCAKPGDNCLMVITPGYRITLQSGEQTYILHTDRLGKRIIFCDIPELSPGRVDF